MAALRNNLNDSISEDDAAAMLSQHLITRPVFEALFGGSEFTALNPVSQVMQRMADELADRGLEAETDELAGFYASVRRRVEGIDTTVGRQRVAIELYDNFFRTAFPRDAERLGIVYTPVEIVDVIIRAQRGSRRTLHAGRRRPDVRQHRSLPRRLRWGRLRRPGLRDGRRRRPQAPRRGPRAARRPR